MIRYLIIITFVFIFNSSNLYAQFNLELPQIGNCDNKISNLALSQSKKYGFYKLVLV